MLLGNKRSQGDERNWSVVLSPIRSEIDKKKISQKISEVFSLSSEEASDLVANTPIILLDHLSRPIAMKVKEFFRSTGAEILLTNDIFLKRKCYRTVWPEPPSLSFLNDASQSLANPDSELLPADQALNEIRTITEADSRQSFEVEDEDEEENEDGEEELDEEEPLLNEEAEKWRRQPQSFSPPPSAAEDNRGIAEKEKEIRELKVILSQTQEKSEAVREEYRQAREIFDQKIQEASKLNDSMKKSQKDQEVMRQNLEQRDHLIQQLREEAKQIENRFREATNALRQEKVNLEKTLNEKIQEALEDREKRRNLETEVQHILTQAQGEQKTRTQLEVRLVDVEKRVQDLQLVVGEQEKALQFYQRQLEVRERELESARRQIREVNNQLEQREAVQKRIQLANQLVDKESLLKLYVKDQERLEAEIREREEAMRKILAEQEKIEKDIIEIRQSQRHFMESSKREQAGKNKSPRIANPEGSMPQSEPVDGDSETPHD